MMLLECQCCQLGHKTRIFLLVVGVFLYLVLGALVFRALEEKNEKNQIEELKSIRSDFAQKIDGIVTDTELEDFISAVVKAGQRGVLATDNVTFDSSWSFGQSFFFVGTLVTTVGYGHTVPLSYEGKVFAILYSLIGVPLVFIMFSAFVSRLMRPLATLLQKIKLKLPTTKDLHVRLAHLLIVLLLLLVIFFFIPSAIFSALEPAWNYTDSLYYCFISLTTIGLGDYIPGEVVDDLTSRAVYKIAVTFYLFLGIISMLTTVAVICNIKELNLSRYFVLDDSAYSDIEEEHLAPKSTDDITKYTEETTTPNVGPPDVTVDTS